MYIFVLIIVPSGNGGFGKISIRDKRLIVMKKNQFVVCLFI